MSGETEGNSATGERDHCYARNNGIEEGGKPSILIKCCRALA